MGDRSVGAEVIIVTGAGGVGKSSLIQSITGHDVYVGNTLESGKHSVLLQNEMHIVMV